MTTRRQIPGFYYDEAADAYFAIPKDGCTVSNSAYDGKKEVMRLRMPVCPSFSHAPCLRNGMSGAEVAGPKGKAQTLCARCFETEGSPTHAHSNLPQPICVSFFCAQVLETARTQRDKKTA
eukprot:3812441-Rhodomonas_salina.2